MALIQIISAKEFIRRLSLGRLNETQTIRATAYLRAKGHVFYDDWSNDHCIINDKLPFIKSDVLEALRTGSIYSRCNLLPTRGYKDTLQSPARRYRGTH